MNFWICSNCGKKVAETLKSCPYCKALQKQGIAIGSDNSKNLKIIIGLLFGIIVIGAYFMMKGGSSTASEQPKPLYIVQQKSAPQNDAASQAGAATTQANVPQPVNPQGHQATNKAAPPVAIEAVNALKKLQARTQVGITYKDYAPALGEAKFALNLFVESSQSKDFPELVQILNSAFETFKISGEVWDDKFSGRRYAYGDDLTFKKYHPLIFSKYPEADKNLGEGGIVWRDGNNELINIGKTVSFLFSKANEDIQKASAMIGIISQ